MSASIRTVLVDDEPPARERLAALLAAHPQIEIVGEAWDVKTAFEICTRVRPDLLFLDIQLPRASGFDLIAMLGDLPSIIFVTAYDRYALRAFDVNALDYLLKPIHPERLATALARLNVSPTASGSRPQESGQVALQEDRDLRFVPLTSITHIEAQDNYTLVHLVEGGSALIRRPLAEWEQQLPKDIFLRLGRSLLVRIGAVHSLKAESRDRTLLTLTGFPQPVPIGRRASLLVRRALDE